MYVYKLISAAKFNGCSAAALTPVASGLVAPVAEHEGSAAVALLLLARLAEVGADAVVALQLVARLAAAVAHALVTLRLLTRLAEAGVDAVVALRLLARLAEAGVNASFVHWPIARLALPHKAWAHGEVAGRTECGTASAHSVPARTQISTSAGLFAVAAKIQERQDLDSKG
jgi:hypothetical protein